MSGFGRYRPFPKRFGGGKSSLEVIHRSLLAEYAPGWDVSDESIKNIEAFAEASMVAAIWAMNGRLSNQAQPMKMFDWLTEWEYICDTRPGRHMNLNERRKAIALKLRGLSGNTLVDISDAAAALGGSAFEAVVQVSTADEIVYWPGQNPGPPGLEWSTNRCVVGIRLKSTTLSEAKFNEVRNRIYQYLDGMLPSWMRIVIGVGDEFIAGVGVVGRTFL